MKILTHAIAAAAVLAGGSALAQSAWMSSPETKALHEAAKKEGAVVLWGTAAREIDWIPKAFAAAFPGIEVQTMADNNITTKAIAEARAGRNAVDVMMTSLSLVKALDERSLLKPMDWSKFGVPKGYTAYDNRMAFTHNMAYAIAYNKDKVKAQDVPKSWAELLDPKYKGKMVANQFLLPRMVGVLGLAWGEDKTVKFATDLRANADIMLTNAPREPFLQSGERLYAVAEVDSFPKMWARDGVPVELVIPEPVVTAQFGAVVMDKAPHPAAAQLLAGWLASPEGKREREKAVFQIDYLPTSTDPVAKRIYASGTKVILDTPELLAERDALMRKIAPIVAGQAR